MSHDAGAMQAFSGIKVVDVTHVLAGPFAAYQLALLGADVIKVEHPDEPDQARFTGGPVEQYEAGMGAQYLAQGSNKRAITLDLKDPAQRDMLRRLAADCDVFVENYRPGALKALGLGYEDLSAINPSLIYCSMSAFGQTGPRAGETAYDNVIQAASGIMAMSGTPDVNPIKCGVPFIDYATGTTAAFALAAALFHRQRTGQGQHIDVAMLDVALIMSSSFVVECARTGVSPKPRGNGHPHYATNDCYETKDGLIMLGAGNIAQQRRLWEALGQPEMVKTTNRERLEDRPREAEMLTAILAKRPGVEWEKLLRQHRVPASRVRTLSEAIQDPHVVHRDVVRKHASIPHAGEGSGIPTAAFRFATGGPKLSTPPPTLGQHNEEILGALDAG